MAFPVKGLLFQHISHLSDLRIKLCKKVPKLFSPYFFSLLSLQEFLLDPLRDMNEEVRVMGRVVEHAL